MNRLTILGVIGLVLLCVLCTFCRAPAIEEDVRAAALACAEEVGLDPGLVAVSGRDVTLTGTLASEALSHHLTNCIAAFPGTRLINNQLQVLVAGALGFQTHYGDVTISGVVPTAEAQTAIIDIAVALWGADNVADAIEVDPGRTIGGWSDDGFALFLAALHHSRRDLDIELTGGQAIVGGTVLSGLAKGRVLGGAAATLLEFEIEVEPLIHRAAQGSVGVVGIESDEVNRAVVERVVGLGTTREAPGFCAGRERERVVVGPALEIGAGSPELVIAGRRPKEGVAQDVGVDLEDRRRVFGIGS